MINVKDYKISGSKVINKKTSKVSNISISQYINAITKHDQLINQRDKMISNRDKMLEKYMTAVHSKAFSNYYRFGINALKFVYRHNLTSKELKVISFILLNISTASNKAKLTYGDIQKKTGISRNTISNTYRILEKNHLAKFMNGHIFVNPEFLMRGSDLKYTRIFCDYKYSKGKWWRNIKDNDEYSNSIPSQQIAKLNAKIKRIGMTI